MRPTFLNKQKEPFKWREWLTMVIGVMGIGLGASIGIMLGLYLAMKLFKMVGIALSFL